MCPDLEIAGRPDWLRFPRAWSFVFERNLGHHTLHLFFGIGKALNPLLTKRSHHLGRYNCIDGYTVFQQVCCPFPA